MGEALTRHSLRPLTHQRDMIDAELGREMRRENAWLCSPPHHAVVSDGA
jgi:hypothetical protein